MDINLAGTITILEIILAAMLAEIQFQFMITKHHHTTISLCERLTKKSKRDKPLRGLPLIKGVECPLLADSGLSSLTPERLLSSESGHSANDIENSKGSLLDIGTRFS